jgi:hypothetical protein
MLETQGNEERDFECGSQKSRLYSAMMPVTVERRSALYSAGQATEGGGVGKLLSLIEPHERPLYLGTKEIQSNCQTEKLHMHSYTRHPK